MVDINPLPPDQNPAPAPVPPPYQPPAAPVNPYDFITNPATPQTAPPKKQRILIVAVLFFVLLMVGIVLAALLSSKGGGPKDAYIKVVQEQNQLIHVSQLGEKSAHGSAAKNLAVTGRLSLTESQGNISKLARKAGVDTETVPSGLDSQIDSRLADAELNNRFDEEFISTMQNLLGQYQKDLKAIYDQTPDSNDKKTLQQAYNSAQQLISDNKTDDKSSETKTP